MPQNPYNAPVAVPYYHISNAGTFAVKATPGTMFSININSGSTGATIELFDQSTTATGTVVVAGPITVGTADILPLRVLFGPDSGGLRVNNGLVALTTGTLDVTLGYR